MLEAHVVKRRAQFVVDAALEVERGQACGLFGASGAGKSTILACIAGAETPDEGSTIALDGNRFFPPSLPLHRRPIGYLTQDANLFPHLTVGQNVGFGVANAVTDGASTWVAELRERLVLAPIWDEPAHAISGGQARRVALARMLARKPPLVLLDEPFSGLDRSLVRDLLRAIAVWQEELGFAMVAVDHEAEVLERLCPRAIVVERGRIVQEGKWSELRARPATPLLAELLAPI